MRWQRSHAAEVTWRGHEAASEVVMPETVDHYARGKWILGRGDPLGQCAAPAAGEPSFTHGNFCCAASSYHREESRFHELALSRLGHRRKICRRRIVGLAGLRHVTALEVRLDALRRSAGNRIVSRAIWSEPVVAVANSGRDRQRFGKLRLPFPDLRL